MALATTNGGKLNDLNGNCKISIGSYTITPKILPEISDTKRANYSDTPVIGRSFPIKTYANSENRVISMRLHFISLTPDDIKQTISDLWALESATYPRDGSPYLPPPVCTIACGSLLGSKPLCVILESYSVSGPNNVIWDINKLVPYYFSVETSWQAVYAATDNTLPNQSMILQYGN